MNVTEPRKLQGQILPVSIPTIPAAVLPNIIGIVYGPTADGPLVFKSTTAFSKLSMPPNAEPIITPTLVGSTAEDDNKSIPASAKAKCDAATAKWVYKSFCLIFFLDL